jgi:hypothetical protein
MIETEPMQGQKYALFRKLLRKLNVWIYLDRYQGNGTPIFMHLCTYWLGYTSGTKHSAAVLLCSWLNDTYNFSRVHG